MSEGDWTMTGQRTRISSSLLKGLAMLGLALAVLPQPASAVPSFARQTGLACEACHTVFPQLTPFGRTFKASGYTLFNTLKVQDIDKLKHSTLSLSDLPPISAMVMASTSMATKANDAGSSAGSTDFPQQASLFYAGRISDNIGAFIQITYDDQSGAFGMDNTDIRFADVANMDGHTVIYGVSLNNNPTVQDLWNSAPAWSEPFISSPAMQTPVAGAQILGAMAGVTAGLSTYVFVDQSFYAEIGGYRSALQGQSVANQGDTTNNIISGVAPYWRLAYEYDWGNQSLEVGTSGIYAELRNPTTPGGNAINNSLQHALTDNFTDYGLDGQYQYISDDNQLTVTTAWVHEHEGLNASFAEGFSANTSNNLDNYNVVASYYWQRKFGASLGFYGVNGSTDPLYFGTNSGNSNSDWGVAEIDYVPWLNVKLGLQYTLYTKFDGGTTNYDGLGRNASDNNMLFAYLWVSF
jgi:hypothetical protein